MSEVIFYQTVADRKKINKAPSEVATVGSVKIKTPCSVMTPTIQVAASAIGQGWIGVNYARIPAFGRYYFVENITAENHDILTIELKCDVLMSYADLIMGTQFQILRASKKFNKYFIDPQIPLKSSRKIDYDENDPDKWFLGSLPQSVADANYNYVMTVSGG